MAKSITACGFPEEKVVSHPPKLIGMLVDAGLNEWFEWPDSFDYCAQDANENVLVFCDKKMRRTYWDGVFQWLSLDSQATYDEVYAFVDLAEDYQTTQIMKQEYLDAMGKAKKEMIKEVEPESLCVPESNRVVKVDVALKPISSTPAIDLWYLPSRLSEYSR